MYLLETNSAGQHRLSRNFVGDSIPRYAILSHTWGADEEEVTFRDLMDGTGRDKTGYKKIRFCEQQARRHGLQYFWIDTCCIDKASSAELQEAITSMFRWYRNAAKCYVYLSDISTNDDDLVRPSSQSWQSAFQESRWFTRGWTLQELIAPPSVEFFCSNGKRLGDKKSLERQLHEITGIAVSALQGTDLSTFSVSERMSWAKHRETTREEDQAYSLLGLFGVYLLHNYGEGAANALNRLGEEVRKRAKKRQLDDISMAFSNSNKRSKAAHNQSSVPPLNDANFIAPGSPSTKQSIIDQLYFDKIDERLTSLTAAQGKTCRWFLTKPEYTAWHDVAQQPDHGGFLWIKGHPGTGKSTLMKLLFEEAKLNAKNKPLDITLSFFFLARGTVEEKSTTGLYRSLLHQLFEKAVELRDSLEWMTADGARGIERDGWNEEALKQTLKYAVSKLGNRSLVIFVDALDECNQNQAEGMVSFFEELGELAQTAHIRLQICFSSRHYPTIIIQRGIEIVLEDEVGHTEDIEQYIRSKLKVGKSKQAVSLRSEILAKSSRIFLWVVLVLDILNSEYRNASASIKEMRGRLKEIPPKLADLFEMILTRHGENMIQLQVCLKLILFANRPLKPQELYFAIQLGLQKDCSGYWDQEEVDLDQMKTYVRSSSKGLAEVTRNNSSEVQFIHESVRDFLLGSYGAQWSGVSRNFLGHSHELVKNCCLAQLNAPIGRGMNIPDPLPSAKEAAQLREEVICNFPFLGYATHNTLHHANDAQRNGIDQREVITNFPLQQWVFLNNILERYDIRRYTKSASILYILAERNLADLIHVYPHKESCFNITDERYGPPIFAAVATSSDEAVRALLGIEAKAKLPTSPLHDLFKQYCPEKHRKTNGIGRDFKFSRHRTVLSYIAEYGDEFLLRCLLALGQTDQYMLNGGDDVKWRGWTPLGLASWGGHEAVVKLLLEKGAEIDLGHADGKTPLSIAVDGGHEAVVKLLLERGTQMDLMRSIRDRKLLPLAAKGGHEPVVRLLLEKGADIDAKIKNEWSPLLLAADKGHEAVVRLLLEKGAQIDSKNTQNETPLSLAANRGHELVVRLLLEKGADIDAKSENDLTPLLFAARIGHEAVVRLLLEKGAEIDAKDEDGRTPLLLAANKGHEAVVSLLLDKGTEIDAKDKNGWIPLFGAVFNGYEAVVRIFLKKGVEIDGKNGNGWTLLQIAAKKGHEAVVKLLLDKGADIDSKREDGWTPLFYAVRNRHLAVVEILLQKGAEINLKDAKGQTPLSLALEYERISSYEEYFKNTVKLLLEHGAEPDPTMEIDETYLRYLAPPSSVL